MTELKELEELIGRGLDPKPYSTPVTMWRAPGGRTVHGADQCDGVKGVDLEEVTVVPLNAEALCECWPSALPDLDEESYGAAWGLRNVEMLLEEARKRTGEIPQLLGLRLAQRELPGLDDPRVTAWFEDLTNRIREQILEVQRTLSSEERRARIVESCALERVANLDGDHLGDEALSDMVGDDTHAAMAIEATVQGQYATMVAEGRSRDEIVTAIHQTILEEGPEEITTLQLHYSPKRPPRAGESLAQYVRANWELEMESVAELLHQACEDAHRMLRESTRRSLLLVREGEEHSESQLEMIEAYRIDGPDGYTAVIAPEAVARTLELRLPAWRGNPSCPLEGTDTTSVVETALALWDPNSKTLGHLADALDAARRV